MQFNNLSVVEFNNIVKNIFDSEEMLFNCAVVGEISSFKISGNIAYFTIKDEFACLNCVWFSADKNYKIGEKVKVVGRPNFYVKGGKLNFNVVYITSFGEGDIYKKFCELKEKLAKEGYFINKKELPKQIKSIGVVSSSKGAVIKDIISVAKRRNPNVDIFLFPSKVQGDGADKEICKGINFFAGFSDVDVIIVARGGGSSEDLNAFNSEIVAKACFVCEKPIISAVGHETDYTLIDLVADIRASTPSVAAEIAVKESKNYEFIINQYKSRIVDAVKNKKQECVQDLRLKIKDDSGLIIKRNKIFNLLKNYNNNFKVLMTQKCENSFNNLKDFEHKCEILNPNLYKKLGLAVVEKKGEKVENINQVFAGDEIRIFLNGGELVAKIEEVKKDDNWRKDWQIGWNFERNWRP